MEMKGFVLFFHAQKFDQIRLIEQPNNTVRVQIMNIMLSIWQLILALAAFSTIVLAEPVYLRPFPHVFHSQDTSHTLISVACLDLSLAHSCRCCEGQMNTCCCTCKAPLLDSCCSCTNIVLSPLAPTSLIVHVSANANRRKLIHSKKMLVRTLLCCISYRSGNKLCILCTELQFLLKIYFRLN